MYLSGSQCSPWSPHSWTAGCRAAPAPHCGCWSPTRCSSDTGALQHRETDSPPPTRCCCRIQFLSDFKVFFTRVIPSWELKNRRKFKQKSIMRSFVSHLMVLWLLWWQLIGLLQTQDWGPLVHWPRASSSPMLEKREQAPLASVLVQATHSASSCNVLNATASSLYSASACNYSIFSLLS